jgi:hypothetical protein
VAVLAVACACIAAGKISDAARAASGIVISGQVVDRGVPVAGATVLLRAWPSQATQLATPAGTRQTLFLVGVGRTNADGSYTLGTDLGNVPAAYRAADGTVNLVLMAVHNGRLATTSFPADAGSSAAQTAAVDLATGAYSPATQGAETVQGAAARAISPNLCGGGYWTSPYGPYQTKLGDAAAYGGIVGQITYSYGGSTSTTLGVAFNNGSGWSASGTSTAGTSSSIGFIATGLADNRVYGLWRYHDWVSGCGGRWAYPYDYVGRGQTTSISHPYFPYCGGWYYPGNSYVRNSSSNQTYSVGLTVDGVGLSSQAGWSSSMTLIFKFSVKGHVCGDTTAREAAPRVEAQTY